MILTRVVNGETVILSTEEEAETLAQWEANAPVEPRRLLPKSVVQERLNTVGKLVAAFDLLKLSENALFFGRWFAPDWPNVYADDEDLLMILAAAGCDEVEISTIVAPLGQ